MARLPRSRLPGGGMRDAAYNWAGKFGSGRDMPGKQMRTLGRTRLGYGAAGVVGLGAANRMRSPKSSGRDGLQPHSSGGTMMY